MPLIPGRRTSNMRQAGLREWLESKNSSAEANTLTSRRTERISLSRDLRTETSSSTTETSGAMWAVIHSLDNRRGEKNLLHLSGGSTGSSPAGSKSSLGPLMRADPQVLRHPHQIGQR